MGTAKSQKMGKTITTSKIGSVNLTPSSVPCLPVRQCPGAIAGDLMAPWPLKEQAAHTPWSWALGSPPAGVCARTLLRYKPFEVVLFCKQSSRKMEGGGHMRTLQLQEGALQALTVCSRRKQWGHPWALDAKVSFKMSVPFGVRLTLRSVSLQLKQFLVNKFHRRGHSKGLRKWGGRRVPPGMREIGESAI